MVTIVISTDYHGDRKLIHRVFRCIGSTFFPAKIDFLSQIRSCRQFIELVSRTLHASCTFVRRENWKKQIAPAFGGDFVDGLRFKILVGLRSCSAAWFDIYIYIYSFEVKRKCKYWNKYLVGDKRSRSRPSIGHEMLCVLVLNETKQNQTIDRGSAGKHTIDRGEHSFWFVEISLRVPALQYSSSSI